MEDLQLVNFPYPHTHNGTFKDGFLLRWPERCGSCQRKECITKRYGKSECPSGYNFEWFFDDFMVGGILLQNSPLPTSQARAKRLRQDKTRIIHHDDIRRAITNTLALSRTISKDVNDAKANILKEYERNIIASEQFQKSIFKKIEESFASLHDYKQFVTQILQNINTIIHQKYNDNIDSASHYEKAIYYACRMMEAKLKSFLYYQNPHKIVDETRFTKSKPHSALLKILKIYQSSFDHKEIKTRISGTAHGKIYTHFDAFSIIPHTLIDNALKYAPRGSSLEIEFKETDSDIEFEVTSLGPKIYPDEMEKIFYPFYRGKDAEKYSEEGTGFGLHLAKLVANRLGSDIIPFQEPNPTGRMYRTSFNVCFPRCPDD